MEKPYHDNGERRPQPRLTPGQRRKRAARDKARKRRRALLVFYLMTILTVLVAAVALSLTVLFQISEIRVTGTSRYSEQEIIQTCTIKTGENLFLADTGAAEAAMEEKLPYIGKAKVSRQLPARILIEVEEAPVSGVIQYGENYVLLSPEGKVLEKAAAAPEGQTVILGLALKSADVGHSVVYEDERAYQIFSELAGVLETNGITGITKIDLSDQFQILVEYEGRITINLGLPADMDYKVRFAKEILNREDMKDAAGVLNLSNAMEDDRAYFEEGETISETLPSEEVSSEGTDGSAASSGAETSEGAVSTVSSAAETSGESQG